MNIFNFTTDGFRIIQLVMAFSAFFFSSLFSFEYFKNDKKKLKHFLLISLVIFISVVGIFLSADLLTLFVSFEIMSLTSYLWVVLDREKRSFLAGKTYITVSIVTGMVSLVGIIMLKYSLGTINISEMMSAFETQGDKTMVYTASVLALVGFFAKAGMYPIHFWMSDTYRFSPTPATILLSSVLSKTGVFGVIVVTSNIFMGNERFGEILLNFAIITMLWGGLCAVVSEDFKKIMAYSSMSQLGFVFLGLSMQFLLVDEKQIPISASVLHMLNHSVFKLVLFTLCGVCFCVIGSTKLEEIKGIGRRSGVFAFAFLISGLGLAGLPLLSGYISKTLLHESIIYKMHETSSYVFTVYEALFVIASALTTAYVMKILFTVFGHPKNKAKIKLSCLTKICLIVPCVFVVILGVFPHSTADVIAHFGSEIMHPSHTEHHAENYFAYKNISAFFTSFFIGTAIYFVFIKLILKEVKTSLKIPKVLKIENILNLIFKAIMLIFDGFIFITDKLADKILVFIQKKSLRPSATKDSQVSMTLGYFLGEKLDKLLKAIKVKNTHTYANDFSQFEKESSIRRRMIFSSLSYGLLLSGVGLIVVLLYLLVV